MADREQRSPELDEFERHLSELTPRPQRVDRAGARHQTPAGLIFVLFTTKKNVNG